MAARTRASFTDDDSLGEQSALEMVRIDAPQATTAATAATAAPAIHVDPDGAIALDESGGTLGTSGLGQTDFLNNTNTTLMEGVSGEYEVPNLFTYKKVEDFIFSNRFSDEFVRIGIFRLKNYLNECKMKILVSQ